MRCLECDDYTEVTKNDDGSYESWCDCGYHESIIINSNLPEHVN